MEEITRGKSINGKSSAVDQVLGSGWVQRRSDIQNNIDIVGRGRSNRNVGVLQGLSESKRNRPFKNVLENIFEIQSGELAENNVTEFDYFINDTIEEDIEDMTPESIRKQDESFKNDQRGIQKQELPKRIKDATDSFLHSLTRVFPEIPESGEICI